VNFDMPLADMQAFSSTSMRQLVGSLTTDRACQGGVRVETWRTGQHSVLPPCGVWYAWTLGLVRRPVALLGLLRRCPSETLQGVPGVRARDP
jgi:hypothetical protein